MLLPFDFTVISYTDAEKLVELFHKRYDKDNMRDFAQMKADNVHELFQTLQAFIRLKWQYRQAVDNASLNALVG
jgi:hypothetical protein